MPCQHLIFSSERVLLNEPFIGEAYNHLLAVKGERGSRSPRSPARGEQERASSSARDP